jgi:hypothetical protein
MSREIFQEEEKILPNGTVSKFPDFWKHIQKKAASKGCHPS